MRLFEVILVLSCLPALAMALLGARSQGIMAIWFFVPVAALAIHAGLEGMRMHLVPAYLVAAILAVLGIVRFALGVQCPGWFLAGLSIAGFVGLCAGVALGFLFPVFSLPRPSGSLAIGTVASSVRDISFQLWYPADPNARGQFTRYLPEGASVGGRLLSNVALVRTHARADVPVAEGLWPVLLYSPSWDGGRFENTALFEALASEGFVVVAMDRPAGGGSLPPLDFSSSETFERFRRAAEKELALRVADLRKVLDALDGFQSGLRADGRFKGRLDLQEVGALGYSFGGAVAAEACRVEPRLKSGADLDGILFGEAARSGATQPFLFVTDMAEMPPASALQSPDAAVRRDAEFQAASLTDMDRWLRQRGGWLVRLTLVQHANFSDRPLYSRLRRFTAAGPADPHKVSRDLNAICVAFFRQTLRNSPSMEAIKGLPGTDYRHDAPRR